jgi:hypothetical protein
MTPNHRTSPARPAEGQPGISPAQPTAFLVDVAARFGGRSDLNRPRYKLLWQTVAIAASMLIFASLRPATTDLTAGNRTPSTMLDVGSKELGRTVSGTRSPRMGVSKTREAQLRRPAYFVAKDFTNHFSLRAQSVATVQKSELTRLGQGSVSQKRVVANYTP